VSCEAEVVISDVEALVHHCARNCGN
jgi:hypothetical protein